MEPDADDILEEGGDFSEFRNRCVELVKDVVFIVGSANVFREEFDSPIHISIQRPALGRSSRFCVYFFSSSSCNFFLAWQQSSCSISPPASGTAKKTFNRTLGQT